jgi:hypothetical protein
MGLSCKRSDATVSHVLLLRVGFALVFTIVISHSICGFSGSDCADEISE